MTAPVQIGREEANAEENNLVRTDNNQRRGKTDGPPTMMNLISPDLFSNDSHISGSSVSDHAVEEANADKEEANADKQIYENRIAAYAAQLKEADADKQIYENRIAAFEAQLKASNADKQIYENRIAAFEAQLEPKPDNVVADIEELREVRQVFDD
ncbi:uncharacterized protein ACN2A1_010234 [Glossina fuscipes fuscipes]